MEHDLNFQVLSIKFGLYSSYNLDNIQHEHLKLASLELCYLEQHYLGLYHCWRKTLLLEDLYDFLIEFNDIFGKIDRVQTATTKFQSLGQGSRSISVYVADFHQLACDIDWDDNALISAFC